MMDAFKTGGAAASPSYSLVIPTNNEEAVLGQRIGWLLDTLDGSAEAIFVDDGSRDTSATFLRATALASIQVPAMNFLIFRSYAFAGGKGCAP
jgi:glycosyltransferase involved in cell wall biosynthesis